MSVTYWGTKGDIAVPGDYDGDTGAEECVVRPGQSYYWFCQNPRFVIQWGTLFDIPVPADYDGDGKADCAVYRSNSYTWFIRKSSNPSFPWIVSWGTDGDIPFPAKMLNAAYANICVYRPSDGFWFSYDQFNGTIYTLPWGIDRDLPVSNDWESNGFSNYAVFRPSEGNWFIVLSLVACPQIGEATVINWGTLGDKPRCRRSRSVIAPPSRY